MNEMGGCEVSSHWEPHFPSQKDIPH
jgi:hypothetical protein